MSHGKVLSSTTEMCCLCNNTDGEIQTIRLQWTIPNFRDRLQSKKCQQLRSELTIESENRLQNYNFLVKLQIYGINSDIIEIFYMSHKPLFLKTDVSLQTHPSNELHICTKEYHSLQGNKWQYLTTLYRKDGIDDLSYLFNNNSLRIRLTFMITHEVNMDKAIVSEAELNKDLEDLLNDGLFCDITIKSVEGKEYIVHKAILASRSVVLKAHFKHNTTECHTNIIESPFDSEVLQDVLTFIYSDRAPRVDEIPDKLLAAADYYQLCKLKEICEESLRKKLTIENAIDTLQLADLHTAHNLKKHTLEYIKDDQAYLMTKTNAWAQLKSVELIKSIFEYVTNNTESTLPNNINIT